MLALIWIVALGASTTVELTDNVYTIPAEPGWHLPIALKQRPARVLADFDTRSARTVRLTLMRRDDLRKMRRGAAHQEMASTGWAASGTFDYSVRQLDDYALVIDHQSSDPVDVHLRVRLDFTNATGISSARRLTVIALSFVFFFSVVTYSARRLLRSVRR